LCSARLSSLMATAAKVCGLRNGFTAASAALMLSATGGASSTGKEAAGLKRESIFGVRVWHSLADLVESCDGKLTDDDVVNLIHMCSLYWRTNAGNVGLMGSYVDRWAADEKKAIMFRAAGSDSMAEMLRYLANNETASDAPPFGAMAPLAVVAARSLMEKAASACPDERGRRPASAPSNLATPLARSNVVPLDTARSALERRNA